MYYYLNRETDIRKIGKRDRIPTDYPIFSPTSQGFLKKDRFPDFIPVFSNILLHNETPLTDFLHSGGAIRGHGFIINKRVKDILSRFNLPPHRYYPLVVIYQDKVIRDTYYWVQLLSVSVDIYYDFSSSQFKVIEFDLTEKKLAIKDYQQLRNIREIIEDGQYIDYDFITLNKDFLNTPLDMFSVKRRFTKWVVSEHLKKALAGITGLKPFRNANISFGEYS